MQSPEHEKDVRLHKISLPKRAKEVGACVSSSSIGIKDRCNLGAFVRLVVFTVMSEMEEESFVDDGSENQEEDAGLMSGIDLDDFFSSSSGR